MNNELLNELNTFRATEGKTPFADWRKARHMPMLEAYRAEAQVEKDVAEDVEVVNDEDAAKIPSYKELARTSLAVSTVAKPVELVRTFLSANPQLDRKAAVAALVGMGVNFSTARTQYQKWYTANKG